ncbi:MAG: efflux RND transporter permease subunit [Cyclobacteriaceae bacterium]
MNQVKGVKEITSSSEVGRGNISLSFVEDTDMQLAAYEVSAMVRNVYRSLPEGVSYPWINVGGSSPDDRPVLVYALLTPPQQPELPGKLREQLENKLQHWPGIKQISVYGGQSLQWRLTYQLQKMKAFGIDEGDLRQALGLINLRVPLGRLDLVKVGSGEQMGAVLRSPYQKDWQWQQAQRKGTGSKEDV